MLRLLGVIELASSEVSGAPSIISRNGVRGGTPLPSLSTPRLLEVKAGVVDVCVPSLLEGKLVDVRLLRAAGGADRTKGAGCGVTSVGVGSEGSCGETAVVSTPTPRIAAAA